MHFYCNQNYQGLEETSKNNSVNTSKLYASYSNESKNVKAGDIVDKRNIIYYSNVNAESTRKLMQQSISLKEMVAEGWNGVIATDPDGASYIAKFINSCYCFLFTIFS